MRDFFGGIARGVAHAAGTPHAFLGALSLVVLWAVSGPLFGYSERWQLVINTGTTIVTFLMVFLIQNSQNRDQEALQLKLDELLKAARGARTGFVNIEEMTEEEIGALREQFRRLADKYEDDVTLVGSAPDEKSA